MHKKKKSLKKKEKKAYIISAESSLDDKLACGGGVERRGEEKEVLGKDRTPPHHTSVVRAKLGSRNKRSTGRCWILGRIEIGTKNGPSNTLIWTAVSRFEDEKGWNERKGGYRPPRGEWGPPSRGGDRSWSVNKKRDE